MIDDIDLHGLALELHRSYDWTARHWRRLAANDGLPAPFIGASAGGRAWWARAAVIAWKQGGAGPGSFPQPGAPAANDEVEPPIDPAGRQDRLLAAAGGG